VKVNVNKKKKITTEFFLILFDPRKMKQEHAPFEEVISLLLSTNLLK